MPALNRDDGWADLPLSIRQRHAALVQDIQRWKKTDAAKLDRNDGIIRQMAPVRDGARKITRSDLYAIAHKKSPRGASLVRSNSALDVQQAFDHALKAPNAHERIRSLTKLNGVDVAVASCILAWTCPKCWGVIDQRAWRALYRRGLVWSWRNGGKSLGPEQWSIYCRVIGMASRRSRVRPQHIDLFLYDEGEHIEGGSGYEGCEE